MLASDIAYKHIGKRFRSLTYPNKNKTAKPNVSGIGTLPSGKLFYLREPDEWTLRSFQFFDNGNIIVNQGHFYLRPTTEVELVEQEEGRVLGNSVSGVPVRSCAYCDGVSGVHG